MEAQDGEQKRMSYLGMTLPGLAAWSLAPRTETMRRALAATRDHTAREDLLFLETWEIRPSAALADALRARQILRANPALVSELRAELARRAAAMRLQPAE
jgi:hypothetical protein